MQDFWNDRFSQEGYSYGIEPNVFFKQHIDKLAAGKLLLPAEGEGRNAVYAARQGWQVTAFDYAEAGKKKALQLANQYQVSIHYLIADYDQVQLPQAHFDTIALIYAHVANWQARYARLFHFLKPGGYLIAELFAPQQLGLDSGGPKDPSLLVDTNQLKDLLQLQGFQQVDVWQEQVWLNEGKFHQGRAHVTRALAIK